MHVHVIECISSAEEIKAKAKPSIFEKKAEWIFHLHVSVPFYIGDNRKLKVSSSGTRRKMHFMYDVCVSDPVSTN